LEWEQRGQGEGQGEWVNGMEVAKARTLDWKGKEKRVCSAARQSQVTCHNQCQLNENEERTRRPRSVFLHTIDPSFFPLPTAAIDADDKR